MKKAIQRYRTRAFLAQQGRCCYCNFKMWLGDDHQFRQQYNVSRAQSRHFQCTAEHIIPRCDGGSDAPDNIAAACYRCNHLRHARKIPMQRKSYKDHVNRRVLRGAWHVVNVNSLGLSSREN